MLQVLDRSKVKIWYIQVIHRLKLGEGNLLNVMPMEKVLEHEQP